MVNNEHLPDNEKNNIPLLEPRVLFDRDVLKRFFIIFLYASYFVVSYELIAWKTMERGVPPSAWLFPYENKIPFIPYFALIYSLVYVVIPAALFLIHRGLKRTLLAFFVGMVIQNVCWYYFPLINTLRPAPPYSSHDWLNALVALLYQLDDPPVNCFPSLHVSYAFLSYYTMRAFAPQYQKLFFVLAISISISTLFFKQHYLIDVLGGWLLAYVLAKIFYPRAT